MLNFSDYINVKEASKILGVHPNTLRNWEKHKKLIPVRHPSNNYRMYLKSDIDHLLNPLQKNK